MAGRTIGRPIRGSANPYAATQVAEPRLPAAAVKTYSIAVQPDREVIAACEQVGCEAWTRGWRSVIDESTPLGRAQAAYIRGESRRTFREERNGAGLTVFTFESRQRCFTEHRTRPELFLVTGGDWRGNPRGELLQHSRPADWVDDFANHQDKLADRLAQG